VNEANHIVLIGMMGAGKSTVGLWLQKETKRVFYDIDDLIEKQEGMPISEIFIAHGEAHFRRVEADVIGQIIALPGSILATGGGAFIHDTSREKLLAAGKVFYLQAKPETLAERVKASDKRPLLQGVDILVTILRLLEARHPYYGQAHYTIETEHRTIAEIGRDILSKMEHPN
jgi:shikimate kinase